MLQDGPNDQRMPGHILTRNVNGHGQENQSLRIGTINLSTLRGKEEEVIMTMQERKIDILGLCETRLPGEGTKLLHDNYQLLYKGGRTARHGVGLIVSEELAGKISHPNFKSDRIISFSLKLGLCKISIIQVYAPQQGRPQEEKEEFFRLLQEVKDSVPYTDNVLIIGDLNGHVGQDRTGIENVIGAFSIGNRNREGENIVDFCVQNQMSIMNSFYKHRDSHKWTWYRWNSIAGAYTEKSMIDLAITNNKNLLADVKSIPSVSFDSDHRLLLIKLKVTKPRITKSQTKERFILENIKNDECLRSYQSEISRARRIQQDTNDPDEKWRTFKNAILNAATNTVQKKRVKGRKKKQTPWWTPTLKSSVANKMRLFRKWMKTRRLEDHNNYKEACRETERVKAQAKTETWVRIGEDLEDDLQGTRKLIYSTAKNYRKGSQPPTYVIKDPRSGIILTEPREIDLGWKHHFETLLNNTDSDHEDRLEFNLAESLEPDITALEVKNALKKMKNGKAPGVDTIPAELLKNSGEDGVAWLLELIDMLWNGQEPPKDWRRDLICPIYKKGDKTNCNNYRGISLMSHAYKVYERILENRLREHVEPKLGEWQNGFRPGRGTTDMIFSLKMIFEKSWEWDKDQYIAFIDLEKAFDRAPREKIWEALRDPHYGIPEKLTRAIYNTYLNIRSRVKTNQENEDWFEIRSGVRQGSVLSPLLFILFMDKCMREQNEDEIGDMVIDLVYADDHAMVAQSADSLQQRINNWNTILTANGMRINKDKTEIMVMSRTPGNIELSLGGQILKQCRNFKYLGVEFSDQNDQKLEITTRIQKYNNNLYLLYPLMKDRNIPRKVKTIIYLQILRPILTYGHESWTLTSKTRSQLQAAEMKALRLIKGVTRLDRLRNEDIRRDLEVEGILEFVERGQLRWFGHTKRMEEERYPRRFLEWTPQGRRPVGRPKMRWLQNIETGAERRGSSVQELEETRLYDNRQEWRRFVKQAD